MNSHQDVRQDFRTIAFSSLEAFAMTEWRLAEAKNRFSELVTRALAEGPQRVRRHDAAVIVPAESEYQKLTGKRRDFKQFLMGEGPSLEGVDLTRDDAPSRQVEF